MDFLTMPENELVAQSRTGNQEAMDQLVVRHWDVVYHHCLSVTHDEAMAEDLAQETFLHAFSHLASFQERARFSTWIWRIAHNLSLNYLKKQHHNEQPLKEELIPSSEKTAYVQEDLKEALNQLDEKQRRVCELYLLQRMPQKEIARHLGIPYGTVRSRLHYGRLRLREYYTHMNSRVGNSAKPKTNS